MKLLRQYQGTALASASPSVGHAEKFVRCLCPAVNAWRWTRVKELSKDLLAVGPGRNRCP